LPILPVYPSLRFRVTSPSSRLPPFHDLTHIRCLLSSSIDSAELVGVTAANVSSSGTVTFDNFGIIASDGMLVTLVASCPWINGDTISSEPYPVNVTVRQLPFAARYSTVAVLSASQLASAVTSSSLAVATMQCDTVLYQIRLGVKRYSNAHRELDGFNVSLVVSNQRFATIPGPLSQNVTVQFTQQQTEALLAGRVRVVLSTPEYPQGELFAAIVFPEFGGLVMLLPDQPVGVSPPFQPSCQVMFEAVSLSGIQITASCDFVDLNGTASAALALTGMC
jgi:hypothetical protein